MFKKRFAVVASIAFVGCLLAGTQSPASADPVTVLPRNQTISTNQFNTCIISAASRVQCWGDQYSGVMMPIVIPSSVADLAVKSVSTNEYNTCVLTTTGTLHCWGYLDGMGLYPNVSGAFGSTGDFTWENVNAYSASGSNICVIPASASAYCWGFRYSATGYGMEQNIVPDELGLAKSVSTNFWNTCVTLVAGGVTCWGYQAYGYGFSPISAPTDLGDVVSLSTSPSNACAVQSTGVVRCWGRQYASDNWDSQHFLIDIAVPTDLAAAVSVSTSDNNTCVTLVSGPLQCWGGTQSGFPYSSLVVPAGLSRVAGVSTGSYNTCAVKATGTVQCWGIQNISDSSSSISVPSGMATANIGTMQSPGSVGVEIGQGSLTVSWSAVQPMVRGNTVTYTASAGSAAHSCSTTTTTSCEITGLTNGQSYAVTVVASDGDYASVPSVEVAGLPIGPASAPTITSAVTGSGKVTLSIAAPAELGDVALTGYEYSTNHGSTWAAFGSLTGPFVITGLTNGTTYLLKVRAVNSWGVGTASGTTTATPTNLVPAVAAITSTTVGDKSVSLGITAPEGVTAASVSGYKYSVNNGVSWLTGSVADGVMTITGLHNGVTYSIKVRAINSNGSGVASTRVTARPCALATAPTITSVTGGNAKATIAFEEPDDNGGTAVSNYQYSLDGGSTWVTPTRRATRSPLVITGLTNGTTYSVALRAVTAAGSGATSDPLDVTPATVPGAPSVVVSAVASTSVNITLTAPASNGGSEILSYCYTLDSGKTWVPVAVSAIGSSVAVTGLSTYKSYSVKVKATNAAGSSLSSAAKAFKTLH